MKGNTKQKYRKHQDRKIKTKERENETPGKFHVNTNNFRSSFPFSVQRYAVPKITGLKTPSAFLKLVSKGGKAGRTKTTTTSFPLFPLPHPPKKMKKCWGVGKRKKTPQPC